MGADKKFLDSLDESTRKKWEETEKETEKYFRQEGMIQFWVFLLITLLSLALEGYLIKMAVDDFKEGSTIGGFIGVFLCICLLAWIVFAFLIVIIAFQDAYKDTKLREIFWMRYIVAPVVVGVILGLIGYLITGEFTVGAGGIALVGSIITIIVGNNS